MHKDPLTFSYKTVHDSVILLDIYPPVQLGKSTNVGAPRVVPAVVYFHGGGLTVGNRKSWFPHWLKDRVTSDRIAFISADYRLLPPSTGHDILQDIKNLFQFIASDLNQSLLTHLTRDSSGESAEEIFEVDPDRIVVAGNSAGGLCAYLAAIHATPRPRALVAMYSMGGNFLIPHYIVPKTSVFFRGREILDPEDFEDYMPPCCHELQAISDSPLAYQSADYPIPGYPANPRMLLARLYLQLGIFLDFYTGLHGLSLGLRQLLPSTSSQSSATECKTTESAQIPPEVLPLFPHLSVTPAWPPTFLVHGAEDTAVLVEESRHMQDLLISAGVPATLRVIPDKEHSFDYAQDAETEFGQPGGLFDEVKDFILEHLYPTRGRN